MIETIIREQYNQMAQIYDQRWKNYISKTLSFLKNWAEISSDQVVLDLGCGTGEFERLLLTENPEQKIIGIDISEEMLVKAKYKCQGYPNVSFQQASVSSLPFNTHTFDVIVSASAFHYFEHPETAIQEIKRVLKPDGKVVILDWCKDYLLMQFLDFGLKFVDPAYKKCYTENEFHYLLTSGQFNIKRSTKFNIDLWWQMMIVAATPEN
ncbi:class I SAM-dependent methyltransferase [Gloeothece verrucosa]|uniref:Methyltransferase type 11 n=1 Tax=Gloeothece verrucosa (strain PCC 7822) TaxID=497965 RepID=E0UC46_GLOV7|nr:class I SAM-dependent methyltransferase [Gloeothece verrucosa]ADN16384.1 Methyltransferase type 11 [Gloeothece verrucosa PCC 7822]